MIAASRLYLTASVLGLAAIACLLTAFLRRDAISDLLGIEGAYFERSVGEPASAVSFSENVFSSGNVFDPFSIGNAYLWLGAGCAFAVTAVVLLVLARLGRTR